MYHVINHVTKSFVNKTVTMKLSKVKLVNCCFLKFPTFNSSLLPNKRYMSTIKANESTDHSGHYPLFLYNHYTKLNEPVDISGQQVFLGCGGANLISKQVIGSAYVCGPTVYDNCHIGHAMAYLRFDIFRRFLQSYSNLVLVTAMGITDIDEKILTKAVQEKTTFKEIGDKYFTSFLEDLNRLNVQPVDLFVRITHHIDEIIDYIGKLEEKKFAYINEETGDVNFDTSKITEFDDGKNMITDKSKGKKSPKDFALWRSAKSDPIWVYQSPVDKRKLPGRPGWHVECSVIASWLFGSSLDFHFGGKDLIFPHHFCESACSSAYFNLTSQPVHKWAKNWIHSSHVKISKEKMSKSLGNVISIKDFLNHSNVDILRIMCIYNHYRSDLEYDSLIVKRIGELDRRLKQFLLSVKEAHFKLSSSKFQNQTYINCQPDDGALSKLIKDSEHEILSGAANDLDMIRGLDSILELIKYFDTIVNPTLVDLHCIKSHVSRWMQAIGLSYELSANQQETDVNKDILLLSLVQYRNEIRTEALKHLKKSSLRNEEAREALNKILKTCDNLRDKIDSMGYIVKDEKFKPG